MTNTFYYQYIEKMLLKLFDILSEMLTDSEKCEVEDFINVSEYGLALETLVDIVIEENKLIPSRAMAIVCELADVMQLDKKLFEDKLCDHVTGS